MTFSIWGGCPCCGQHIPNEINNPEWLADLQILAIKHESLGVRPDITSLSFIEAWGLYLWLSRIGQ